MSIYVVGFALDPQNRVALIRKNRPEWQAGLLNGIGGHIENTDATPAIAMRREFAEETGVTIDKWDLMLVMEFPEGLIYFARARVTAEVLEGITTMTDEEVGIYDLEDAISAALDGGAIPNLAWLLPLAAYTADRYNPFRVVAEVAEAVNADPTSKGA